MFGGRVCRLGLPKPRRMDVQMMAFCMIAFEIYQTCFFYDCVSSLMSKAGQEIGALCNVGTPECNIRTPDT